MDCRAFAAPKELRPRRRVKPGNGDYAHYLRFYNVSRHEPEYRQSSNRYKL
jgi:hypothetical protein